MNTSENLQQNLDARCYDKKCIIIGGGLSDDFFLLNNRGAGIEKDYDVIMYVNDHKLRYENAPRCDWLVSRAEPLINMGVKAFAKSFNPHVLSTPIERTDLLKKESGGLFFENNMLQINAFFLDSEFERTNPYSPALEHFNYLRKELRTNPLAGIIAIHLAMRRPFKEIAMLGFDFYHKEKSIKRDSHYLPSQVAWLAKHMACDYRLRFLGIMPQYLEHEFERYSKQINTPYCTGQGTVRLIDGGFFDD